MAQIALPTLPPAEDPQRAEIFSLFRRGSTYEAADRAHRWLTAHPQDWEILDVLAASCLTEGNLDEAEKIYTFCLVNQPKPYHTVGLAQIAAARGENKASETLLRAVISEDPTLAVAWYALANVHRFVSGDPLLISLRKQAKRRGVSPRDGMYLNFALSKAYNDLGKWDKAWRAAEAGNTADMLDFEPAAFRRRADDAPQVFDQNFLAARPERGSDTSTPIFVVGAPRSGTTLVERLLCGTGAAMPMGEVSTLNNICAAAANADRDGDATANYFRWVRRWRPEAFSDAATLYLKDIARRAGGACPDRFVDKMPGNILNLGALALMFPKARIVRLHRDPLDTGVSLFMGRFGAGHHYTARLDWIGAALGTYRDAGDFYAEVIPNPVLDVVYEDLVTDPEGESQRLFEFAGLDWTADVLNSSGGNYTSTTRSMMEVQEKVSTSSVGRWRRYRKHLGPLADALGVDLSAVQNSRGASVTEQHEASDVQSEM